VPQLLQRRNNLALRVWQQMELVKAQVHGGEYRAIKYRSYTGTVTGTRRQVEQHVTVSHGGFQYQ
jgi:hypothetical protein